MNVLMTTDNVGGVWTYSLELAAALAERAIGVDLASMGSPVTAEQRRQVDRLKNVWLHPSPYKLEWMEQPWADVDAAGRWLMELEARAQPDVIHLNGYCHGSLPWAAPVVVVAHSCVLSWWQAVKKAPAPRHWDAYKARVRHGLRSADFVVAPTRAMFDELLRLYGPLGRTCVIPNCRTGDGSGSLRRKEPIVFAAGRGWDEGKNLAILEGIGDKIDSRIVIAGCEERQKTNVTCLGWVSQAVMADWRRRAAIFAHPARYEPFGLAVLEAALAGCALVLGDIPSLHEVWSDCALFADPEDPDELAKQIRRLECDRCLRNEMAIKARRRGRRYQPQVTAGLYADLYHRLLREVRDNRKAAALAAGPKVAGRQSSAGGRKDHHLAHRHFLP